eukprot:6855093-Prymnesium_polylepis.1
MSAMKSSPRTDTSAARPPKRRMNAPTTTANADATNAERVASPASRNSASSSRTNSSSLKLNSTSYERRTICSRRRHTSASFDSILSSANILACRARRGRGSCSAAAWPQQRKAATRVVHNSTNCRAASVCCMAGSWREGWCLRCPDQAAAYCITNS